mgnify:CR=1 FL=1
MIRNDPKLAFYATATSDSKIYAASLAAAAASTTYLDLPPGYYDAWIPGGAGTDHVRWCYLPVVASPPTLAPGDFPAPTAAAGAQVSGVPAAATGAGWAPADSRPLRIHIAHGTRAAFLYSGAAAAQLNLVKVL